MTAFKPEMPLCCSSVPQAHTTRPKSFQFSVHTVKIKDRRIFHDFLIFFDEIQFKNYLVK
jgi:hypothetical protein